MEISARARSGPNQRISAREPENVELSSAELLSWRRSGPDRESQIRDETHGPTGARSTCLRLDRVIRDWLGPNRAQGGYKSGKRHCDNPFRITGPGLARGFIPNRGIRHQALVGARKNVCMRSKLELIDKLTI